MSARRRPDANPARVNALWFTALTVPLLLELRDAVPGWDAWAAPEHAAALCLGGSALMARDGDAPPRVLLAGGVATVWPGRGLGWAIIGPGTTRRQVAFACRYARARLTKLLRTERFHRIEASVVAGYAAGHVLVRGLGFDPEFTARRYGPDGRDHVLYARVI